MLRLTGALGAAHDGMEPPFLQLHWLGFPGIPYIPSGSETAHGGMEVVKTALEKKFSLILGSNVEIQSYDQPCKREYKDFFKRRTD